MEKGTAQLFRPLPQVEVSVGGRRLLLQTPTAAQVLEAKSEAALNAGDATEEGLMANACVLAKVLMDETGPVFSGGKAVLAALTPGEIGSLSQTLAQLCQEGDPGMDTQELDTEGYLEALRGDSAARLRWKVQKAFHALPTEERVREMHPRDYLYCLLHLILDEEEELSHLCPSCRQRAQEKRCTCCGASLEEGQAENPAFDQKRFDELREEAVK
jgi:hypothetical protein